MKSPAAEALSGIFSKPPERMAELLSSEEFIPGGPAAGLRMLATYTAFAGRRLSASRRKTLERTRELLTIRVQRIAQQAQR